MLSGTVSCNASEKSTQVLGLSTVTLRTDPSGKPIGYTIIDYDQPDFLIN